MGYRDSLMVVLVAAAVLGTSGCRRAAPPAADTPTGGRLVPQQVAGFEEGAGAWKAEIEAAGGVGPDTVAVSVTRGAAARGDGWLKAGRVTAPAGTTAVVRIFAPIDAARWEEFGETLRADVRLEPAPSNGATARLFVSEGGKPSAANAEGAATPVTAAWTTLGLTPETTFGRADAIGVRVEIRGPWNGSVGLDNVRVGAAEGLSKAWAVVDGPFPYRAAATDRMRELAGRMIDGFPVSEGGKWYVNLGTFRSEEAARTEAARLKREGLSVSVLRR